MSSSKPRYRYGETLHEAHERAQRARGLRRETLLPERILWKHLRNRQLLDLKFRRQYPIEQYTLDFYCEQLRLAIEVDGMSHEARRESDAKRDAFLTREGIQTVRFPASIVLNDLDSALRTIAAKCEY